MAFTTVTGSNGITSLVGTTGVDTATIVTLPDKVFVGANTEDDVLTINLGTGGSNASNYDVRMGGGDDNFTTVDTILNSFISLDGETLANDGHDNFLVTGGTQLIINSEIVGRGGNDNFGTNAIRVRLQGSTINGNTGFDTIFIGASNSSEIYGGKDQDSIVSQGDLVDMMINGNKGDDTIRVSIAGVGTFSGTVFGGQGADLISVSNIENRVDGANLSGDDGSDTIIGSRGMDTITGGNDNDTLTGAANADTMTGGTGNDVFAGYGTASVADVNDGANKGFDTITDFSASTAAVANGDTISTGTAGTAGNFILQGAGGAAVLSDSGADLDAILTTAFAGFAAATTANGVITITAGAANAGIAGNYFVHNQDGIAGFQSGVDNVIKLNSLAGFTAANIANVVTV